jgi:rubrerythrin
VVTQRAQRFTGYDRCTQLAVESRRRGDCFQIRLKSDHRATFRCNCGYVTTKAMWLEQCPLCGVTFAKFANEAAARNAG